MNKQKFKKYDLVYVDTYSYLKSWHRTDCLAIVLGTEADELKDPFYDSIHRYELYIKGLGLEAYYDEGMLTFIKGNKKSLLNTWKKNKNFNIN